MAQPPQGRNVLAPQVPLEGQLLPPELSPHHGAISLFRQNLPLGPIHWSQYFPGKLHGLAFPGPSCRCLEAATPGRTSFSYVSPSALVFRPFSNTSVRNLELGVWPTWVQVSAVMTSSYGEALSQCPAQGKLSNPHQKSQLPKGKREKILIVFGLWMVIAYP